MTDTPDTRAARRNTLIGAYISAALTALLAVASYGTSQFVQLRDAVRSLDDRVPIQLESINRRLDTVDQHQNTQDQRLYDLERGKP